jgi:putative drug exporter of the RND superfamily
VHEALDMYLSDDRKTAQMTVILDVNPYSQEAMSIIQRIEEQAKAALRGTDLREAELAIAGKASQNADLKEMSGQDFVRTMALMLAGIGLVLVVITRSVLQPLAIIASLGLAYGTSLGLTELLLSHLFGIEKLGWNVPFFSFVMIVALGVDYSIFLMMRYREVAADAMQAIVEACTRTGSVVISAAVILGGTFAALYPSGVLTLIEVATVVIIGLMLLSLVMLPVFIPAVTVAVSKLNMWSYKMKFKTWKESA